MSISAINWCIEQKDLPPGEWVVLFHLAHCHNHETSRCDPSQAYLAQMTNMGERTVRRHLNALEKKGRIARKKRAVDGGGRVSDSYALGHQPAKMAAYLTGQSVQTNRPNGAEKVHEMAGKRELTGKEQDTDDSAREEMTLREAILSQCGVDPVSGITGPNGGYLGTRADMAEAERWEDELGLTRADILGVVRDVMSRKSSPPSRFSYFNKPMAERAGEKLRDPLSPAKPRDGPRRDSLMTAEEIQAELERDAR